MRRAVTYPLALLCGGLLTLAFPEPDLAPLAWVALAPVLVAIRGTGARSGAALGFVLGVGFFGTLLTWISIVGWVAWGVLVALQAAFFAALGAGWALVSWVPNRAARVAGVAAVWVAVEWFRSLVPLGGFTWGQLAQSQHNVPWVLEGAALAGAWLVAFLLVACNALIAEAWLSRRAPRRALPLVLLAGICLGGPSVVPSLATSGREADVAIVQGNVPEGLDERPYEKELRIIASHEALTNEVDADVDLVVWPESALGLDPFKDVNAGDALRRAAESAGVPVIAGANIDLDDDRYKVVALLASPQGEVVDRYEKTHLVPFGEYVPARDALDWLPMLAQVPRDAVPGEGGALFDVAGGKVAPVISFEGDFGSLVRERIASGGRLLVVATNTSTWGYSWASAQHVAMSQVRAAENGVWVVHAAISGISAFIAPDGRVTASSSLWEPVVLQGRVAFAENVTPYARMGDWLPWVCIVASFALCAAGVAARRRERYDAAPDAG